VVAQGDLRPGPARPGLPDQPVLPALRHAAVSASRTCTRRWATLRSRSGSRW
jgi:hypothetical protein